MKRLIVAIALGCLVSGVGIAPAGAQTDSTPTRSRIRGADVDRLLRDRERLALTDEQIERLRELRSAQSTRRAERSREMIEVRSLLRSGEITRDEARERLTARRQAHRDQVAAFQERVSGVLTEAQTTRLREIRLREARSGRRGMQRGGRGYGRRPSRDMGPRMMPRHAVPRERGWSRWNDRPMFRRDRVRRPR